MRESAIHLAISAIMSATLLIGLTAMVVVGVRSARRDAVRSSVYSRLTQLHLAVVNHEDRHGSVPPAFGPGGKRNLNWLAFVLRECEEDVVYIELDFSQPWDSPQNQLAVERSPLFRDWLSDDGFTVCPLRRFEFHLGSRHGNPRGSLEGLRDAILFVAVPITGVDPLPAV